ncbi:MAG: hypothetical protein J3R72DRAFT_450311 [Linnemannia gamsii]|nr:MAG: hypothetical protein J3R72DRAFT_450311 [Linnemannia gamsii]
MRPPRTHAAKYNMHLFSTIMSLVSVLILLSITTVLAQTSPPAPSSTPPPYNYSTPCSKCIVDSAIKLSSTCTIQSFTTFPSPPHILNDLQKSCYCPLTSSNAWITYCIRPELCNAVSINALFRDIAALRSYACSASPPIATTSAIEETIVRPSPPTGVNPTAGAFYPYQPYPYAADDK